MRRVMKHGGARVRTRGSLSYSYSPPTKRGSEEVRRRSGRGTNKRSRNGSGVGPESGTKKKVEVRVVPEDFWHFRGQCFPAGGGGSRPGEWD